MPRSFLRWNKLRTHAHERCIGLTAGFYYYFKPILAAWSNGVPENAPLKCSPLARLSSVVLIAMILILGVYPRAIQGILKAPAAPAPAVSVVR